jgi:NitT/TauT family transport system substrate-binding protein
MKLANIKSLILFRALIVLIPIFSLIASCKAKPEYNDSRRVTAQQNLSDERTLTTIRFRPQWYHQAQFAGVYMAYKKGFYRNYGLHVEIQNGGPEYPAYDSLQSGQTDVTQLFLLTALTRDAGKNNLVNLAQISQKSSLMLVGKKSRGINSIADFQKKKIGLWRTDFRELSLIFLEKNGLNMDIVNLDSTINLFLNDVVDVINVMRYNEYHKIIQSGINPNELFIIPFSEYGLNVIEDGLYTTREFYELHPKECASFAEATLDGWIYAINHREETIDLVLDIMKRHFISANRSHQTWMLNEMREVVLTRPSMIGILQESDFNFAIELLKQQGLPVSGQSYKEFYPNAR